MVNEKIHLCNNVQVIYLQEVFKHEATILVSLDNLQQYIS
jgi:hypothetical protein